MVEKIEKISNEYHYLFELDKHLEQNRNLEVDEILLQVCNKDREIQFGRKISHLNSRALNQNFQNGISDEKASLLRQTLGVYLEGAAVACSVAAAVLGVPALGEMGFGKIFSAAASYNEKVLQSQSEMLSHSYQRVRDMIGDHAQQMQSTEKEHEQNLNMIDRLIQNSRRQSEMIVGG